MQMNRAGQNAATRVCASVKNVYVHLLHKETGFCSAGRRELCLSKKLISFYPPHISELLCHIIAQVDYTQMLLSKNAVAFVFYIYVLSILYAV